MAREQPANVIAGAKSLWSDIHQCAQVAASNAFHLPWRTFAAVTGIGFSILLVFIQLGFLNTAQKAVTRLYGDCHFDLAIVSRDYQFLCEAGSFDRIHLSQAHALAGITATFGLNTDYATWTDPKTELKSSLMLIGLDPDRAFIIDPDIRAGFPVLRKGRRAIIDSLSHKDYGALAIGGDGLINGFTIDVTGHFQLGMFFFSDGSAIVDNSEFTRLTRRNRRRISIGLIRLAEGANPERVANALRRSLPEDVLVYTKKNLIAQEQDYFISARPVGILFRIGVFISYLVGMVILYQVLATDIANHIREFATLKAMGFGTRFIYGIGIMQAVLLVSMSFIPTLPTVYGVFEMVSMLSPMPVAMTPALILTVCGLALTMALISALLALVKTRRADPAELF
uniref:Putative ABC transport system permease protein n=1 Tax=Candidatus Kentrum sp. FW TaxID=2126338 RepID=A0A450TYR1_9GAMM|nr:MAG: putative ABC transport system permease protein [Candidatus Kentron sp. FW]